MECKCCVDPLMTEFQDHDDEAPDMRLGLTRVGGGVERGRTPPFCR